MSEKQRQMLIAAQRKHGAIRPAGDHTAFADCFTSRGGRMVFRYNSPDGSTHTKVAACQ